MVNNIPAPWEHRAKAFQETKDPMFWFCDVIKGGIRIARVSGRSEDEAEANARFICKAVNHHKELIDFLNACLDCKTSDELDDFISNNAEELIAKAESEDQQ